MLLSIDAQSKEEVDAMVQKAIEAGGTSNHKPSEMKGWMYGCVFTGIDGHKWNVLYMDLPAGLAPQKLCEGEQAGMSKMQKA